MSQNKQNLKEMAVLFNGKKYKVPPGGTLGLLALGNVGVRAWKEAREQYVKENPHLFDEKK